MKYHLIILLLFFGSRSIAAEYVTLNVSPAGYLVSSDQCARLMGLDLGNAKICKAAAANMWQGLSFHVLTNADASKFSSVAFPTQLVELLKSPEVLSYLSNLNTALELSTATHSRLNLYSFTLGVAKSPQNAVRWLAVLFQDYANASHTKYLASRYPQLSKERALLLAALGKLENNPLIDFYPQEIGHPNGTYYHFYVIANMALNIPPKVFTDSVRAAMPFMMNATYEFVKEYEMTKGPSLNEAIAQTPNLWQEIINLRNCILPLKMNPESPSLDDIYLGYAGPRWVLGLKTLSLDEFKQKFTANPREFFHQQILSH